MDENFLQRKICMQTFQKKCGKRFKIKTYILHKLFKRGKKCRLFNWIDSFKPENYTFYMLILKCLAQTTFSWFTRIKWEHIINFKWYTWTTNLNFYSNEVFIHFEFEKCQEKSTTFHTHTNTWKNKILNFLSSQMIVSPIWKIKWHHISLGKNNYLNLTAHFTYPFR